MKDSLHQKLWVSELLGDTFIYNTLDIPHDLPSGNAQVIVFMSSKPQENHIEFVKKIAQASGFQPESLAILPKLIPFRTLKTQFPHLQAVFLFGVPLSSISVTINHGEMDLLRLNGIVLVCAPDVNTLQSDSSRKNYLWNKILKPTFVDAHKS